jgi:hypothetical protein
VESSAFARFFLDDLDSDFEGGLLFTGTADMMGGGSQVARGSWWRGEGLVRLGIEGIEGTRGWKRKLKR